MTTAKDIIKDVLIRFLTNTLPWTIKTWLSFIQITQNKWTSEQSQMLSQMNWNPESEHGEQSEQRTMLCKMNLDSDSLI